MKNLANLTCADPTANSAIANADKPNAKQLAHQRRREQQKAKKKTPPKRCP